MLAALEGRAEIVKILLADSRVDLNLLDREVGLTILFLSHTKINFFLI